MNEKTTTNKGFLETYQQNLVEKTERIVTALYLVTSLMVDQEPLKWQIRDLGLETLNLAHKGMINRLANNVDDLISLVSLSRRSSLVSEMNADLLDKGLRMLSGLVSRVEMFDEDFLGLNEQKVPALNTFNQIKDKKDNYKSTDYSVPYKRQKDVPKNASVRKDKRRNLVMEALRNKADSSIKDIAKQVKGCSEKTIQRELNALIDDGLVEKKGERRWSVYSLS